MSPRKRILASVGLFVLIGVAMTAGAQTARGTGRSPLVAKPVIGQPITVPAHPLAGKRFTVSFKVTRSDTGKIAGWWIDVAPDGESTIITAIDIWGGKAGYERMRSIRPERVSPLRKKKEQK